jgi:hypothetical protein
MNTSINRVLLLASLGLLAACTDRGPTGDGAQVPGELVIALRSAQADAGAIRFTITGGPIAQVAAADSSVTVFVRAQPGEPVAVVVIGDAIQGPVVRVRVPDVREVARYRTTLLEVVDAGNGVRSVGGYALAVSTRER